jgi:hypothetical protein
MNIMHKLQIKRDAFEVCRNLYNSMLASGSDPFAGVTIPQRRNRPFLGIATGNFDRMTVRFL